MNRLRLVLAMFVGGVTWSFITVVTISLFYIPIAPIIAGFVASKIYDGDLRSSIMVGFLSPIIFLLVYAIVFGGWDIINSIRIVFGFTWLYGRIFLLPFTVIGSYLEYKVRNLKALA